MAQALERLDVEPDGNDPYIRLARYVQESPGRIHEPAAELAARFGLPEAFVRDVQESLEDQGEAHDTLGAVVHVARKFSLGVRGLATELGSAVAKVWCRLTALPLRFVLVSGLAFLAVYFASAPFFVLRTMALDGAVGLLFVIVFASHLACFARHATIRVPLVASAALAPGLVAFGLTLPLAPRAERLPIQHIAFLALGLTAFYAAVGVGAAVVGGLVKMRLAHRRESQFSRQEQLDRLFDLERRFHEIVKVPGALARSLGWAQTVRRWAGYPLAAFLAGAAFGVLRVLLVGGAQTLHLQRYTLMILLQMLLVPLGVAVFATVGYLAGGVRKGIAALLVAFGGYALSLAVPVGEFGPEHLFAYFRSGSALNFTAGLIVLGVLTGLASRVENQTMRAVRLDQSDPVALYAEVLRLQRKLRPASLATCVLVVDVAGSTSMKMEADPLKIEYSFRAYQDLVSQIATENGGTVVSRAGDGAVVSFPESALAVHAARVIQSAMPEFNQTKNLLDRRFRLRIGLHSGKTTAELEEVPFNELIDIAAHVERVSPVGGVALTEAVAKQVPQEPTAALQDTVDGHGVRIVLNPTLEDRR